MDTGVFISGVGRPGSEFDDSPPPNAEVKNKWTYNFPPSVRLHNVDREYFKFYFTSPHQVTPNKLLNSVVFNAVYVTTLKTFFLPNNCLIVNLKTERTRDRNVAAVFEVLFRRPSEGTKVKWHDNWPRIVHLPKFRPSSFQNQPR